MVISQLDAQPSERNVVVVVIGTMKNNETQSRKFVQTFFLAYEDKNRYYVLNDIFRFLSDSVFSFSFAFSFSLSFHFLKKNFFSSSDFSLNLPQKLKR